jgi:hypothetical protein
VFSHIADKINPVLRTMLGDRNVMGVPPAMGSEDFHIGCLS